MSKDKKEDKEGMIIGGSVLIGIGVGFFFLEESALLFTASILIGLGLGLVGSQFVRKE